MPVVIYGTKMSAPVRCVLSTLEVLKTPYEFKEVDLFKGENKTPEYLALNPQHTVPTMVDGDVILNESRAIMCYLSAKAGDSKLYPGSSDPVAMARVLNALLFDMGTFYKRFGETVYPVLFRKESIGADKMEALKEVLGWVQDLIKPTGFAAKTSSVTVADINLYVTYAAVEACGHVDLSGFRDLSAWAEKVRAAIPNHDKVVQEGTAAFAQAYKAQAK